MLGGAETYSEPSKNIAPSGNIILIGEDGALVELAVAVGVFEANDAMRLLLELLLHRVVRAGRFGDVEPAFIIERSDDRPLDQRRTGHELDGESVRHFRKRSRTSVYHQRQKSVGRPATAVKQQARNRARIVMPQLQRSYAMYRWSITWRRQKFSPLVLA